jgi:LDH2 family malate/lactate/ureidoglycolate dehydrogenase
VTGYYTLRASPEGLIGMACTGAPSIRVVPAFGSEAQLGTDSWSFAAATTDARPILLDMATTKRLARELQL